TTINDPEAMKMEMSNVKAIVTGGASGLGEATVRRIVERGGQVAIFDLNGEKAQKLIEELGAESVWYAETDVTDANQVEKQTAAAIGRFGSVNLVVNCAGIGTPGKVVSKGEPQPLEQFEKVVRINLIGSFNVLRVAAAAMQKNEPNDNGERGVIISTASV